MTAKLTSGPVTLGALCGLLVFLAGELGWLSGLDSRAYDLALRTRRSTPTSGRVVVVEIDDESISLLGRWPWSRSVHAAFLRALRERYQPAIVVFDLLLPEPEEPDRDAGFAREMRDSGNVHLAAFFTPFPGAGAPRPPGEVPWLVGEYVGETEWLGKRFAGLQPPAPELAEAAAGVGHVNVFPERDGCVRRVPLVIDHDGVPYTSLIGSVLNAAVNPERRPVTVSLGEWVQFGELRVPIDQAGEAWIGYRPDPSPDGSRAFARYTYHSILERDPPVSALRDQVVLVGFGATGMADIHQTPFSAGALGLDINAHALDGLLARSFLRVSNWEVRLGFVLLWALAAALASAAISPAGAVAVAIALPALGWALAAASLRWGGAWPGAAPAGLAAAIGYLAVTVLRHRESERDALRVSASVASLALATRLIGSARRRQDLLMEIRSQVNETIGALQTNLYLVDGEEPRLTLSVPALSDRHPISYALGEGTVGWVARYPSVHLADQINPGSSLATELAESVSFPVGSVVYAPIAHRGQVMGVVEAVRGHGQRPFEPRTMPMLEALAAEAAVALENLALYEKLEGRVEIANRKLLSAYQELKQERDRISAILSNMADGVILTDARGRVVFANPAAAEMLGADEGALVGALASEALPYPALLEQLDNAAPPPGPIPRIHIQEPRRITLSPRTVHLSLEGGGRAGAVTVLSDVTLLEQLSEMKSEFVSVVSHELRTPLTSIMGFAQTLEATENTVTDDERREFLGIIEQEANRLLVMINDLLDVSRLEAGRPLPMNLTPVDLRGLTEHVIRFQSVTTTAHRFAFDFPGDGCAVVADRDKVEQILTNLVSNAIKYSPRGGEVTVGAHITGGECTVWVRDQGIGIAPGDIEHLFERYQRIDRDAIKGIRGTGLGLFLVRALVEAHGGRVWAESRQSEGSVFSFSLPLQPAPAATA